MATSSKPLGRAGRGAVAAQAGAFLASLDAFARGGGDGRQGAAKGAKAAAAAAPPALSHEFPYRAVLLADVLSPPGDTAEWINAAGMWLHLILTGNAATHYAVSRAGPFPKSPPQVTAVCHDPRLAQKIAEAATWLDKHDQDKAAKVSLLTFPSFQAHAFGILRRGKVFAVLVDQPDQFTRLKYTGEDGARTVYALKDFLAGLAREPNNSGALSG